MTVVMDRPVVYQPVRLPKQLASMPVEQAEELACRASLGVWTVRKRKLVMAPVHWEWCQLAQTEKRLALIAPREHSKTETFTVNATAWRSAQMPGLWTYVFCQTGDQSKTLLERIVDCVRETEPWLLDGAQISAQAARFSNGARVSTAGSGKGVRGAHPDIVIGDDVLEEQGCLSELQRNRTERWWKGTVGGMAHPGTIRRVRPAPGEPYITVRMPPTRVFLVGTPFHEQDLLMKMRANKMYRFLRYAAEFQSSELVPGTLAVEGN
jgi:hypothetical protein